MMSDMYYEDELVGTSSEEPWDGHCVDWSPRPDRDRDAGNAPPGKSPAGEDRAPGNVTPDGADGRDWIDIWFDQQEAASRAARVAEIEKRITAIDEALPKPHSDGRTRLNVELFDEEEEDRTLEMLHAEMMEEDWFSVEQQDDEEDWDDADWPYEDDLDEDDLDEDDPDGDDLEEDDLDEDDLDEDDLDEDDLDGDDLDEDDLEEDDLDEDNLDEDDLDEDDLDEDDLGEDDPDGEDLDGDDTYEEDLDEDVLDEGFQLYNFLTPRMPQHPLACKEEYIDPKKPPTKSPSQRARFINMLADMVLEKGELLLTAEGMSFIYQWDEGFYQPISDLNLYVSNALPSETTRSLLARDVREICEHLGWEQSIRCSLEEFNSAPDLVNFQNCVLDLRSGVQWEHASSYRFTYTIQAEYLGEHAEQRERAEAFEAFCRTSLDDDPEKRQLLLEFIGYICSDSNAGKCAMFLKGQPNSGKSIVSEFVSKLFDQSLVCNIPLHQLGDRFFRAELAGKKLNVAGEIAGRALRDISIFKSITGSDRITGEYKGKDPFTFMPICKMLFSGNTLPQTSEMDATSAFVNRIRILLFNQSIPAEQQDKQLLQKLLQEKDIIVSMAMDAYREVVRKNYTFTEPKDSKAFLTSFRLRGNAVASFLEECCVLGPEQRVFNVDLCEAFRQYCLRNGLEQLPRKTFYELLSGVPGVEAKRLRIGAKNLQGHSGVGLKDLAAGEEKQ